MRRPIPGQELGSTPGFSKSRHPYIEKHKNPVLLIAVYWLEPVSDAARTLYAERMRDWPGELLQTPADVLKADSVRTSGA